MLYLRTMKDQEKKKSAAKERSFRYYHHDGLYTITNLAKLNNHVILTFYNISKEEMIHSERKIVSILSSRHHENYHASCKSKSSTILTLTPYQYRSRMEIIIHNTQIERKIVSIFYYHDGLITTTITHLAKRNNMLFTFYSTVLHTVGLWDQSTNLEKSRRRTAGNTGHRIVIVITGK